jgi:hypothetical protein
VGGWPESARNECPRSFLSEDGIEREQSEASSMRQRQQDRLAAQVCILPLALMLGGCSGSEIVQNWGAAPASDPPQPDYRRIVADNIKTIFPGQELAGRLEISGVRLVDHLKGPAWLTCLKVGAHERPQEYALFIQGERVIDSRAGVLLDQCYKETYTPLEAGAAVKKPGM